MEVLPHSLRVHGVEAKDSASVGWSNLAKELRNSVQRPTSTSSGRCESHFLVSMDLLVEVAME